MFHLAIVIIVVGVGALAVRRPFAALLGLIVLRVVADQLWWLPGELCGINPPELFTGLACGLLGFMAWRERNRLAAEPLAIPVAIFAAFVVQAAPRAPNVHEAFEGILRLTSPFVVALLASVLAERPEQRRAFVTTVLLAGILPIGVAWAMLGSGHDEIIFLHGFPRFRGGYHDIHDLGHSMALFAALGAFELTRRTRPAAGAALGAYVALAAVLMTMSWVRTPMLALLLFTCALLLLERRYRALAAVAVSAVLLVAFVPAVQERFSDIAKLLFEEPTIGGKGGSSTARLGSGRIYFWRGTLENYVAQDAARVVFGRGLAGQYALNPDPGVDAHGEYLSLLAQTGPFGLLAYLGIQATTVVHGWRLRRAQGPWPRAVANLAIAGTLLVSLSNVLTNGYLTRVTIGWMFWGIVGVMFAEARKNPQVIVSSS